MAHLPRLAGRLLSGWFQPAAALLLALLLLLLPDKANNAVIGRTILRLVYRVVDAIPLAGTIYGATQTLIDALRGDGTPGGERVVRIGFPKPQMRPSVLSRASFQPRTIRKNWPPFYVATAPDSIRFRNPLGAPAQ